jgi:acyl carrier protein
MSLTTEEIVQLMTPIFRDIMDDDSISVSYSTTAFDIEEWDSLTNIQLIVAVEKYFKIHFNSGEITGFKNVGEMCESIHLKLSKAK